MEGNKWGNKKNEGRGIVMGMPIHALLDLQYLKRWHMVGSTVEDTVASHSFRVAMIAMAIAEKYWSYRKDFDANNGDTRGDFIISMKKEIAYYSIMHDATETYYGDIATHTKDKIKTKCPSLFQDLGFVDEKSEIDGVNVIIKMADMLDGFMFIQTHGIGERAKDAAEFQRTKLYEKLESIDSLMKKAVLSVISDIVERQDGPEKFRIRI